MHNTSAEARNLYAMGTVVLIASTGGDCDQISCQEAYKVEAMRMDGLPLCESELRSLISNFSWAIEGDDSLITFVRYDGKTNVSDRKVGVVD